MPKRDFCCYTSRMALLLLHGRPFSSCVATHTAFFHSIARTTFSIYIRLSFSTKNTAWSVRRVSTYIYDDISCISLLNLNLLNSPLISGLLRVFALLSSVRSLYSPLKPLTQPIVAKSCCGRPQHLNPLKMPFKNPLSLRLSLSLRLPLPEPSVTTPL